MSKISGKQLRVHLTNGEKVLVLFWLVHRDTDVYCGYDQIEKISYHELGQVHTKKQGKIVSMRKDVPLKELEGELMLGGLTTLNSPALFNQDVFFKESSGEKLDNILTIDSRCYPIGTQFNISIGLLEPNRFDILDRRIMGPEEVRKRVKQLLIATDLEPWVWVALRIYPAPSAYGKG